MLFRTAWLSVAVTMVMGLAAASHADDWGTVVAISSTMGVHGDRVCVGEATRGDIGCPTYAPQVLPDGSISASRFVGDGSGLTGVAVSPSDRLVSGSAALILGPTGVLNLTGRFELNSGTGVVGIGTNAARNSKGNHVVAVGLGTAQLNSASYVQGLGYNAARNNTGENVNALGPSAAEFNGGGNVNALGPSAATYNSGGSVNAFGSLAGRHNSGTAVNVLGQNAGQYNGSHYLNALGTMAAEYNSGSSVNALGYIAARFNVGSHVNALGNNAVEYNTGSHVNALGLTAAQYNSGSYVIAIGREAAQFNTGTHVTALGYYAARTNTFNNVVALGNNAQPDKANQIVLGNAAITEVSTAGVILSAGVSTTGTVTATRFVGDGSGLTGVVASTADRIVSGTTAMVAVSGTGFVSLTQAGTNTGWFDPTRGLVTLGVSSTGAISATRGYFSDRVGIGLADPSVSLQIYSSSIARAQISGVQGAYLTLGQPGGNGITSTFRYGNPLWMSDGWFDQTGNETFRIGTTNLNPAWIVRSSNGYPLLLTTLTSNSRVPGVGIGAWNGGSGPTTLSATLYVQGNVIHSSWTSIGFGDSSRSAVAPLEVSGTVSATYVKLADNDDLPCTPERNGTLRFSNGIVSVCRAQ